MKFFRKKLALLLLLNVLAVPLFAQAAARLEALLDEQSLDWSAAAAFALEAADVDIGGEQAFDYAAGRKWLPKKAAAEAPARLDGAALLLMGAFGLKGGIFYSLSKSPHHAYRELAYRNVIRGDPAMPVSGRQMAFMASRLLSAREKAAALEAPE
jgi:hypothetical protein